MKFAIRQRLISAGDDFDIKNEHGKKVYFVDGKAFSFVDDLTIKDLQRNEVARIKKKLFTFIPTYTVSRKGQLLATVRKRPFTLRTRFKLEIPGPGKYEVLGNMFRYDYKILRDGKQVANVSKKILAMSDSYGIEIYDEENAITILGVAIVIDITLHKGK
jgi:uncharacterized protein YxjI